jgi:uncharacterized peroxidase-related enzyme
MFLNEAPLTADVRALYEEDVAEQGYVANSTRLWAWRPDVFTAFKQTRVITGGALSLSDREFAVLISSTVSQHGDAYCSLAWGSALAAVAGEGVAVDLLSGSVPRASSPREVALMSWARQVTADASSTTGEDIEQLRLAGFSERDILGITAIIAFRIAYSTVRTALGALPDQQLADVAPAGVRGAVQFGRPVDDSPSATGILNT